MELFPGQVVWVGLDPTRGREQGGTRPAVVVASTAYLQVVTALAVVVPCTTRERGWPNHVPLGGPTGLTTPTWAMTEQPRTLSRDRVLRVSGFVDDETLGMIRLHLADVFDVPLD